MVAAYRCFWRADLPGLIVDDLTVSRRSNRLGRAIYGSDTTEHGLRVNWLSHPGRFLVGPRAPCGRVDQLAWKFVNNPICTTISG